MARRISFWVPALIAGGFGAVSACGGTADQASLFSQTGGANSSAATSSGAAASTSGGPSSSSGGTSSSSGGSSSQGGTSNASGSTGIAGSGSGGSNSAGGSNGMAGTSAGGTSSAGTNAGGTSSGGATGGTSAGGTSSAGAAGTGGDLNCSQLLTLADQQLQAARACTVSVNAEQCTGKVSTTCNCDVPVESNDSDETKAYLATLATIQSKHCVQVCTQLACLTSKAQCGAAASTGTTGTCAFGPVVTPL